jgi:hypothetical protein
MNTGLSFVCRGEDNFKDNSRHYVCCPIVLSFSLYIFFALVFYFVLSSCFWVDFSGLLGAFRSFFFVLGFSFVCVLLGFFPLSCPFFFLVYAGFLLRFSPLFSPFYKAKIGGNGRPPKCPVTDPLSAFNAEI